MCGRVKRGSVGLIGKTFVWSRTVVVEEQIVSDTPSTPGRRRGKGQNRLKSEYTREVGVTERSVGV